MCWVIEGGCRSKKEGPAYESYVFWPFSQGLLEFELGKISLFLGVGYLLPTD